MCKDFLVLKEKIEREIEKTRAELTFIEGLDSHRTMKEIKTALKTKISTLEEILEENQETTTVS